MLLGYLFVFNNYIPIAICFLVLLISTILSFGFKEINQKKKPKKRDYKKTISEYKQTFKFVFHSNRMKSLILFQVVFYSLIKIIDTYKSDLLVNIGVPDEQFSMILAVLSLIGALSLTLKENIEKKFKNKTLSFISLSYILSCILVGVISLNYRGNLLVPIILVLYVILKMSTAIWWVLEAKYLKSFTTENAREKITFVYELIGCLSASIASIFASILIAHVSIEYAFILVGLIGLIAIVLTLDYMRKRFGLKPSKYKKSDINFEIKS